MKAVAGSHKTAGEKIIEHLCIFLIIPIAMPFILVYLAYNGMKKLHNKNENKRLYSSIFDDDDNLDKLIIQDNLPDKPEKEAAIAQGNALITGDFQELYQLLADDIVLVIYKYRSIIGKEEVIEYWKGWRERYIVSQKLRAFEVKQYNYNSKACLFIKPMLIMYRIVDGHISDMLLINRYLNHDIDFHDDMLAYPFSLDKIRKNLTPLRQINDVNEPEELDNRIPCFNCGMPSEKLEWYRSFFRNRFNGYSGQVSVCPRCGKVVEHFPEMRVRFDEQIAVEDEEEIITANNDYTTNEYSALGETFHQKLREEIVPAVEMEDKSDIFKTLNELSIGKGLQLRLKVASSQTGSTGDESKFYIYGSNVEKDFEVIKHLIAEPTEMAAWQVYLLQTSTTVMPVFWHGGYIVRKFIFKPSDLNRISEVKYCDFSGLLSAGLLLPSVSVHETPEDLGAKGYDHIADIYCCYWNDWKGLVREHIQIVFSKGHIISYEVKDSLVLYEYDCKIMF